MLKRKPNYTVCEKCGHAKAEVLGLSVVCDSTGGCGHIKRLLDSVKLK